MRQSVRKQQTHYSCYIVKYIFHFITEKNFNKKYDFKILNQKFTKTTLMNH